MNTPNVTRQYVAYIKVILARHAPDTFSAQAFAGLSSWQDLLGQDASVAFEGGLSWCAGSRWCETNPWIAKGAGAVTKAFGEPAQRDTTPATRDYSFDDGRV